MSTPVKVAWVRGAYANRFEGQSYVLDPARVALTGFVSQHPLDDCSTLFPVTMLPCPLDSARRIGLGKVLRFAANRVIGDSQMLIGLEREIEQGGYEIVHTADPHYYFSYQVALLKKRIPRLRLVVTSWETIPHNNEGTEQKKKIKRTVCEAADRFVCYTERARTALVAEGVDPQRIETVPLGVDLGRFKPVDRRNRREVRVLFVGRLVAEKGILDLLDAMTPVVRSHPHTQLRIVGNGPLKKRVLAWADEQGMVQRVSVRAVEYDTMHEEYAKADICVVPSRTTNTWEEQYGMVLVEAMASGLPVVSYASGAIPEVAGEGGVVIRPEGDVRALHAQIERLVTQERKRIELGTIARERMQRFGDAGKAADRIAQIYESLIR